MKMAFAILVLIHGLIHILGFAKAFHLAEVSQLRQPIPRAVGRLWLIAAMLFAVSAAFLFFRVDFWWVVGLVGILLSQGLIVQSWTDAKFGSIANLIILIPLLLALLNALPSSYQNRYRSEAEKRLTRLSDRPNLTEGDIRHLPEPVQKYLRYAGAVGKPQVQNFRAVFRGRMKGSRDGSWMEIEAHQYNFFDDPARLFYIESSIFGVPFDGLHMYAGDSATMQINVASLVPMVDARGDKMTQSETVTLFNDMCLLAPATLIDRAIQWEAVDSLRARARFTNKGHTIGATLSFNEGGWLTDFQSNDRYLSADGEAYLSYPWSTPVRSYGDFGGRKLALDAEAIWHTPEGEFLYAQFRLAEIEYNCTIFQ